MQLSEIKFVSGFRSLPEYWYSIVEPTPLQNAELFFVSPACMNDMGLHISKENQETLKLWLNGEVRLPGDQRISSRYAGHQFGVWAGQLGDGRAISLGEYIYQGNRFEIQTKGSGLTPYSRMGDGKAVRRSSIREFLISEHMQALGVPTTRALAIILGEDPVIREEIEKSALVARVFPSNIRFGHFEQAFHFQKFSELNALIEYTQETFFPNQPSLEGMLQEVVHSTAELIAKWMALGFCHGVMNTDNMSFLSYTIDYGPFGFLGETDFDYICNHSDHLGRYRYQNQPAIAEWNLQRLLTCFSRNLDVGTLEKLANEYWPTFEKHWLELYRKKLGILEADPDLSKNLILELLRIMALIKVDYTQFFRQISEQYQSGIEDFNQDFIDMFPNGKLPDYFIQWIEKWNFSRGTNLLTDKSRQMMLQSNPKYILRNYWAQELIDAAEENNCKKFEEHFKILISPYNEHKGFKDYSLAPKSETQIRLDKMPISCSS